MATATKDVSLNKKVSQFFWRSWAIQASWNYERQMNMGFLYGMVPTLDRLYPDESDPKQLAAKKEAYHRHMAFYNCTPQTSAFILGLSASMEEEYAKDPENFDPDSINAVKTSLMGPLSGIGDSFFQGTIRVIAFGLGVQLAQQGSIMGPILAMLISIVPSVLITWFAAKMGYQGGHEYLSKLQGGDLMEKLMYVCGIVGLMSVGGMIATLIGATTPLQFAEGTVVIQDILDGMMPQMISLGLTGLMYWLIKKNVNTGWLLVIAIVGGIATFHGMPVTVIGHRKGSNLDENLRCNFGMPGPEGYRKALRLMKQAEKFGRPIITFIDTPGAYPGKEAEERGQGEAIARNLMEMSGLTVPVIAVVTGEGSSGGALALGVANHILMLENAVYSVLSPEGFASILWKDASRSGEACEMMKLTAQDLYQDGIVEEVIPEPVGGAQRGHTVLFEQLDAALWAHLKTLCRMNGRALADQRYKKYRQIGEMRNA